MNSIIEKIKGKDICITRSGTKYVVVTNNNKDNLILYNGNKSIFIDNITYDLRTLTCKVYTDSLAALCRQNDIVAIYRPLRDVSDCPTFSDYIRRLLLVSEKVYDNHFCEDSFLKLIQLKLYV